VVSVRRSLFWFLIHSTTPSGPFSSRICFVPERFLGLGVLGIGGTSNSVLIP